MSQFTKSKGKRGRYPFKEKDDASLLSALVLLTHGLYLKIKRVASPFSPMVLGTAGRGAKAWTTLRGEFLKGLMVNKNTPKWQKPCLSQGKNPPGYDVDHKIPRSVGGNSDPSNLRLALRNDHITHHKFYHPWKN